MGLIRKSKPLLERLLNKYVLNTETGCWEWHGGKNNIGYGMVRDGDKMRTAHRVSYEEHNDTIIPKGMSVCHTCDNPACINPAHLWVGTMKDNIEDAKAKGRYKGFNTLRYKTCKHCGKSCHEGLFKRWHGDRCKLNQNA